MLPPKVKGAATQIVLAIDNADECRLFKLAIEKLNISCNLSVIKNEVVLLNLLSQAEFIPDIIFWDKEFSFVEVNSIHLIKQKIMYHSVPVIIFSKSSNLRSKDYCYDTRPNEYFLRALSFLL